MSSEHYRPAETTGEVVVRTIALVVAWISSITLAQVQQIIGIISGLVLLGYTIWQWRALIRKERIEELRAQKELLERIEDLKEKQRVKDQLE